MSAVLQLMAGDETCIETTFDIAKMCTTIENQLKDLGTDVKVITLPNVTGDVLQKCISFATHYHANRDEITNLIEQEKNGNEEETQINPYSNKDMLLTEYDRQFFTSIDYNTLFGVIVAANYLEFKRLLRASSMYIASLIKDKTAQEIRELFGLKPAFTPEQEDRLRAEIEKLE